MRKFVSTLFVSLAAYAAVANAQTQTMDPSTILFSTPTLSDELAPMEPVTRVSPGDLVFHEDDWRQIEFYPKSRLAEIQRTLSELKAFEAQNRASVGWRNVYVRKVSAASILTGSSALQKLGAVLNVATTGPGPILFTGSDTLQGRIVGGFSIRLGEKTWLYGLSNPSGVVVLGAQLESGANNESVVRAFTKLNKEYGLILVDWRGQMLLTGVDQTGSLTVWKP